LSEREEVAGTPGSPGSQGYFAACPVDPDCAYCRGARTPESILDCVDGIYCLCVQELEHRLEKAARLFHACGLCRQIIFYRPRRGGFLPREIWASHREIARRALNHGEQRVLILEDDVSFVRPWPVVAQRVRRALQNIPKDWWALYVGHWPLQAYFVRRNILRARSGATHAYIANRPLLEWIVSTEPMDPSLPLSRPIGRSIDAALANMAGMYAIFPMLAIQRFIGNYRTDPHFTWSGERRGITDYYRWEPFIIFHGMQPAELVAVALSPLHRLLMRRRDRR